MALEQIGHGGSKKLEDALRDKICRVCVDRSPVEVCEREAEQDCALFNSLPKIVQAISGVRSDRIDDYVAAIRGAVCEECVHQTSDGVCTVRNEVRCVLDRYLVLIVQTIEEVQGVTLKPGSRLRQIGEAEAY